MSDRPQRGPFGRIHPALILAALDLAGLLIALYLSTVELAGELPYCGPLHGCQEVALSEYSRIGGIPVAVFGVCLSLGWSVPAYVLEGFFLVALAALLIGGFCLGSFIYHVIVGHADFAKRTLPWARGEA